MRRLAEIARAAGLRELIAEILPENIPMLKVSRKVGFVLVQSAKPRSCTSCLSCFEPALLYQLAR
jgi:hypothetical protein